MVESEDDVVGERCALRPVCVARWVSAVGGESEVEEGEERAREDGFLLGGWDGGEV